MIPRIHAAVAASLTLLAAASARADALGDVEKMLSTFHAAKSFHGELDDGKGQKIGIDFVAPDRVRQILPDGTEAIIIGNDHWVKVNGKFMLIPAAPGSANMSLDQISTLGYLSGDVAKQYYITDTGSASLAGVSAHTYTIVKRGDKVPIKLWIGPDSLPLQQYMTSKDGALTVRYSQFNLPIQIQAP